MSSLFNVVFAGEIVAGADPVTVRANVGRLFKVEGATLDRLFSGQRVILKKGIDQAAAMKIRAAMKQAGAVVQLVDVSTAGACEPAAPSPTSSRAVAPSIPGAPAVAVRASPAPAVSASAGSAPGGAEAGVPEGQPLTVARLGTDLIRPEERLGPAPVIVDVSGMSMAPPRMELLRPEERPVVVPVEVDISAMSMAPPGTPLEELRVERPPVNPDISHLSLE